MSAHVGTEKTDQEWSDLVDRSKNLTEKSKVSYKKQMRSIIAKFGVAGPASLSYVMFHPSATAVVNATKHIPDNSLRTYIAAILSLFKRGEEAGLFSRADEKVLRPYRAWSEKLQRSSKEYKERIESNTPSERERSSHASLDEWDEAFETMYDNNPLSQDTLLVAFHAAMHPPLRGGDLALVRIGYHEKGNCIYETYPNSHKYILLIRDHKTSSSHGDLTRTLTKRMSEILEDNLQASPREWLFVTQSGTPFSDSGYSNWKSSVFKNAFDRNVTSNSLRHSYISSMDRQNQTLAEARHVAKQMGHGLTTQRQYVRFFR
jgi:integrase